MELTLDEACRRFGWDRQQIESMIANALVEEIFDSATTRMEMRGAPNYLSDVDENGVTTIRLCTAEEARLALADLEPPPAAAPTSPFHGPSVRIPPLRLKE